MKRRLHSINRIFRVNQVSFLILLAVLLSLMPLMFAGDSLGSALPVHAAVFGAVALIVVTLVYDYRHAKRIQREYIDFVKFVVAAGTRDERLSEDEFTFEELENLVESVNSMISQRVAGENDLRQKEDELEKACGRAEEANRAKSDFLASMSHEIRTPMNAILGFSDLLDFLIVDPKQKKYVDAIRTSGRSLLNLINDILDLSKIEAGRLEVKVADTDFKGLVKELQVMFQPQVVQKGLSLHVNASRELPASLLVDEGRVRQVLVNLVGNAVKFTEHGFVRIEAEYYDTAGDAEVPGVLTVTVSDSGIGIPPEHVEKLFNPFTQIDSALTRKYQGSGLGLSIVKKLVELMNGTVDCHSVPGEGTRFQIAIPAARGGACPKSEGADIVARTSFSGGRVLIVDDIEPNRALVEEILAGRGLDLESAGDGQSALEAIRAERPDIVLLDIMMPEMDGFEVFRRIRATPGLESLPVVALTAQALKQDEERIKAAGFSGYLRKPVSVRDLLDALTRFLERKEGLPADQDSHAAAAARDRPEDGVAETRLLQDFRARCLASGRIKDYEDFGRSCAEAGIRLHDRSLVEYGENVLDLATSFDLARLKRAVEEFPGAGTGKAEA